MESASENPVTPTIHCASHEVPPKVQAPEGKAAVLAAKSKWIGLWMIFSTKLSNIVNCKIDITIGRLTFIISVVAVIVAVLSYGYGAASYHVAKSAYQLQQREFCMAHGDDPVRV